MVFSGYRPNGGIAGSYGSFIPSFLRNLFGKESACSAEDLDLIPGLGRSPGEGNGYLLQYSGLENSRDSMVHGVTKSQKGLSDFHFHFHTVSHSDCINLHSHQ